MRKTLLAIAVLALVELGCSDVHGAPHGLDGRTAPEGYEAPVLPPDGGLAPRDGGGRGCGPVLHLERSEPSCKLGDSGLCTIEFPNLLPRLDGC